MPQAPVFQWTLKTRYSTFQRLFELILAGVICAGGCSTPYAPGTTPTPESAASGITFVAFDLETTGFDSRTERVIEIGAVMFRNGRVLALRSWLINPGVRIPEAVQNIHGITPEMVAGSPSFAEVFPEFEAFVGNAILLSHNASFDVRFLIAELERAGLAGPRNRVIDTLPLFRWWFPEAGQYNLGALAEYLELEQKEFHRALRDAECLYAVFREGVKAQPAETVSLADIMEAAGGEYRLTPNH